MRAIFFVLFAIAAGEALPPDAVPVMCAAICGPIVELSSMCSPKRSLGDFDNQLELRAHAKHARRHNGKRIEEDGHREKRFSVIVPAPTTFPPDPAYVPASSPASWAVPAAPAQPPAQNYAPPTQPQPTPAPAPALPTTSSVSPSTPPPEALSSTTPSSGRTPTSMRTKKEAAVSSTSTSTQSTSSIPVKTAGSIDGMADGREEMENAEERCVCSNMSFNVAEIAGLCASCIGMVADTQNNMEVIMSVCGFPSQQYSPDKDKLASNIWVKATRPTAGVKASRASRSTRLASMGAIMGVGFTIGALMIL